MTNIDSGDAFEGFRRWQLTSVFGLGELPHFRVGLGLEVLRLDASYVDGERSQRVQAVYISQGLCRRCCLPEVILRCMEVCDTLHLVLAVDLANHLISVKCLDDPMSIFPCKRNLQISHQFGWHTCFVFCALELFNDSSYM